MARHDEYMQANRSAAISFQDRSQPKKHWTPPADGFLKLNADGSFLPSIPYGGTGGVIRDSHGQFIAGFSCRMEFVSSPLHIELLALKNGLELLQAMQITRAVVESDCLLAVQAINLTVGELSSLSALITDLQSLLAATTEVELYFVPRQANVVAHRLASCSYESNINVDWFVNAPKFISDALMYDFHRI
ncbi:putative ribonuclease H-like domain-containing protein [Rosa chinensis]|uniref:Putative ribonuclease H-like domain-containing protein n=1 Tax=Rosa chinensis TaxID=74649 RepID=A0A2P6QC43_ROSCH|nr:putative ribonuclease H-like domain-containing protein [Rosa chinensis]